MWRNFFKSEAFISIVVTTVLALIAVAVIVFVTQLPGEAPTPKPNCGSHQGVRQVVKSTDSDGYTSFDVVCTDGTIIK